MFAPANTAHFAILIPSVRNDFKVLAFKGTEAISSLYAIAPGHAVYRQILTEPGVLPEQRLDNLSAELERQLLTDKGLSA